MIAGADLTFLYDAKIKAGPVVRDQQRGDLRSVQPDADTVTGVAWLADLDNGAADPEAIADADFVIGEAIYREVLAKIPGHEVCSAKIAGPVPVGIKLINQQRSLLAAMAAEVALTVAIEIEPAGENPPSHWRFPNRRPDSPAPPCHVLRKSDINRNDHSHHGTSSDASRLPR